MKFSYLSLVVGFAGAAVAAACSSESSSDPDDGMGGGGPSAGAASGGRSGNAGISGSAGSGTAGTSTTGGSTGSGGAAAGCDGACQKIIGAMCPDVTTTQAQCVMSCSAGNPDCSAEQAAYTGCIASRATVTCGDVGPEISGCDAEARPFSACTTCDPAPDDDACTTCVRQSCCAPLKTYVSAADAAMFDTCLNACMDQACLDGCITQYPLAGAAYEDTLECQSQSCAEPCTTDICEPAADDMPCLACARASCCPTLTAYSQTPDVEAFAACLDLCPEGDTACLDECTANSPNAGAAFGNLQECLSGSCLDECSQ